jgi:hypothetical protein
MNQTFKRSLTVGAIPEIQLPDSELCRASIEYARAVSEPFLFHHVMRSAIYADQIGRARGFQYDREVLCVSAVLHDLGLTRVAPVEARFEVEGADAAKEFLARQGMSERYLEIVWDAIALHTTAEIPLRKGPEIALCHMGIATDLALLPPGVVTDEVIDRVLDAYPWLDIGETLLASVVGLYERNPKAAMSHVVADTCERRVTGFRRFNFCDHLAETNRRIVQRTQAREDTHASHE